MNDQPSPWSREPGLVGSSSSSSSVQAAPAHRMDLQLTAPLHCNCLLFDFKREWKIPICTVETTGNKHACMYATAQACCYRPGTLASAYSDSHSCMSGSLWCR